MTASSSSTSKTAGRQQDIAVTDHAIIRWLERGCGVDVEEIRRTIAECCARGIEAGAPVVIVGDVKFVVEDGRVVTTLAKHMRAKRKKPGAPRPPRPDHDG